MGTGDLRNPFPEVIYLGCLTETLCGALKGQVLGGTEEGF